MSNFQFVVNHLLDYVERKAKSFLEKHGLEHTYEQIKQSAIHQTTSPMDYLGYIDNLLNETVTEVANIEKKEWNEIRDEFNTHYLSKE